MANKIILGLVGELAAGKGTVVKYLEDEYQVTSYRFSTPLRDVLNRMHIEVNRQNMQILSLILRNAFGQNLLAKTISEDAKNYKNKLIIIDGIRRPADIEFLEKLPEFKLIYITADIKIRYNRLISRNENADDKNKTFEEFIKDHEVETELAIPSMGKNAGHIIDNSGNLKNLYCQLDKIISK